MYKGFLFNAMLVDYISFILEYELLAYRKYEERILSQKTSLQLYVESNDFE